MNPPAPAAPEATATYVQNLTDFQDRLYAYIYSLIGNAEIARDVLQETNTVLWKKIGEFDPSRPFPPWALGMAKNQVRAARTRLGRERLIFRDDQTIEALSGEWNADIPEDMDVALDRCIRKLTPRNREMVERHYRNDESFASIAKTLNRTANMIGVTLHRIRRSLAECIDRTFKRNLTESQPTKETT